MSKHTYVPMPTFCTICKKEARDKLGNYYVRRDGKGIVCPICYNNLVYKTSVCKEKVE